MIIAGTLTGNDPLKGWIAGLIGIFTAAIGQEAIYAYDRFSFGSRDLAGGFQLVPALVGAFGFAELLMAVRERPAPVKINPFDSVIPKLKDVTQYWRTILRSGVIGTFIGILPGVGEDVAAWSSYAAAKRVSKEKEKFGKGSIDGLMFSLDSVFTSVVCVTPSSAMGRDVAPEPRCSLGANRARSAEPRAGPAVRRAGSAQGGRPAGQSQGRGPADRDRGRPDRRHGARGLADGRDPKRPPLPAAAGPGRRVLVAEDSPGVAQLGTAHRVSGGPVTPRDFGLPGPEDGTESLEPRAM